MWAEDPPRRAGRALFLLVAIAGSALLIAILALLGLRWRGIQRREQALEALRWSHAPVLPGELARAADSGADPSAWLARVAAPAATWNATPFAQALASARRGELDDASRAAIERFEACAARSDVDRDRLLGGVLDVVRARDGIVDPIPCAREAASVWAARYAQDLDLLRAARDVGAIDPARISAALETSGGGLPSLPAAQIARAAQAVPITVLDAAWNERPDAAIDALRVGGVAARVLEGAPLLVGHVAWQVQIERWLDALEIALSRLPRDSDLAWVDDELSRLQPRSLLGRALQGERTFGNRLYELVRAKKGDSLGLPVASTWRLRWMIDADQAEYLDAMARRLERVAKSSRERASLPPLSEPHGFFAPIAEILAPRDVGLEEADRLEARLQLARAALIAFRSGAKDALDALSKSVDPFDGKPLRCATGSNGLVVLWSVGPNGKDDEGRDDLLDVVWRVRLP